MLIKDKIMNKSNLFFKFFLNNKLGFYLLFIFANCIILMYTFIIYFFFILQINETNFLYFL